MVGQIFFVVHIQEMYFKLISSTVANAVGHYFPIRCGVEHNDANTVVRAQRMRIEKHLILAITPLFHVNDE